MNKPKLHVFILEPFNGRKRYVLRLDGVAVDYYLCASKVAQERAASKVEHLDEIFDTFGVSSQTKHTINLARLEEGFSELHQRLAGVVIESLPWQEVVARYDHAAALFFLDPPYWGTAGYGGAAWGREQYEELAAVMRGLEGKALLTINDSPEVREVFAEFKSDPLRVSYTVGGSKAGAPKSNELLYRSW